MEQKKNIESNLERKKGVYSSIALLFALAIVLAAFEYRTSYNILNTVGQVDQSQFLEVETAIISFVKKPPPPPIRTIPAFLIDDAAEEDPIEFASIDVDEFTVFDTFTEIKFVDEVIEEVDPIVIIPDIMPEFPGGLKALYSYLGNNIKYPALESDMRIQGKVFLSFVVEKDGSISDVKVLGGIGGGCETEAIRIVKKMPNWSPGKQRGKKVRVQYNLPINFKLD